MLSSDVRDSYTPESIISSIISSRMDGFRPIQRLLPSSAILRLIDSVIMALLSEPIVINVSMPVHVVGDIHGNIDDLLRIFGENGYPPNTKYLFLGDYIDRGIYGLEVVVLLFALKVKFPEHIFLIRGNHEISHISETYGFLDELHYKYNNHMFYAFHSAFAQLPLVAIIGEKIMCVHGGISPKLKKLSQLDVMEKTDEIAEPSIFADLLWSDPKEQIEEFTPNARGCGYYFNEKALHTFLQDNNLDLLIRSHEFCNGCDFPFDVSNECITVFSNTDYCDKKNDAAILTIQNSEVKKKVFKYLDSNERKMWRPVFPEWLINIVSSPFKEPLPISDEPTSEIEITNKDIIQGLTHCDVQTLVE